MEKLIKSLKTKPLKFGCQMTIKNKIKKQKEEGKKTIFFIHKIK